MAFTLPNLPYAYDALAPHMSKETLEFHHDKHHKAYLDAMTPIPGSMLAPVAPAATAAAPPSPGTGARVAPFSLGLHAVTRGQFAEFVSATGHATPPQAEAGAIDCRSASNGAQASAPEQDPALAPAPAPAPGCRRRPRSRPR